HDLGGHRPPRRKGDDLTGRVHAGVRPPRGHHAAALAEHCGDGVFKNALNGAAIRLHLPAMVLGAVVFDAQLETHVTSGRWSLGVETVGTSWKTVTSRGRPARSAECYTVGERGSDVAMEQCAAVEGIRHVTSGEPILAPIDVPRRGVAAGSAF